MPGKNLVRWNRLLLYATSPVLNRLLRFVDHFKGLAGYLIVS